MRKLKIIASTFASVVILSFAMAGHAQDMEAQKIDTITNEELEKVAATLQQARQIQRQANQELREVVKEKGLEFQRYQTIMISKRKKKDTVEVTEEEKQIMKEIRPQLAEINRQSKQEFQEAIKEHGLTQQRLRQIMLVIRSKPKVAQRFQKVVAEKNRQEQQ